VPSAPIAIPSARVNGSPLEPVSESFAASRLVDPLAGPNPGPRYDDGAGTWLNGNELSASIIDQAGMDLSRAAEVALGWIPTAKSPLVSGFGTTNLSGLP
jgi:hypothetical protein